MPLYAGKCAIYAFLQNMLRSHDRYKPVSVINVHSNELLHGNTETSANVSK